MMFGKTTERLEQEETAHAVREISGRYKFAWWPVKINTGEWAWFQMYWRYAIGVKFMGTNGKPQYRIANFEHDSRYINSLSSAEFYTLYGSGGTYHVYILGDKS